MLLVTANCAHLYNWLTRTKLELTLTSHQHHQLHQQQQDAGHQWESGTNTPE